MSKNDITGDNIISKGMLSNTGKSNFDNIFNKKKCEGCTHEHPHPSANDWCYIWKDAPLKLPCSHFKVLK